MTNEMTIGDFSRATRLSAKALRFYHQAGLLKPARVDPFNNYRVYTVDQIADAQVIRHFRSLDMPVDLVRQVLSAPDLDDRNKLIAEHLAHMEVQLEQTRSAVASLRSLLVPADTPFTVVHRSVAPTPALVIREVIDLADLSDWYTGATRELEQIGKTTAARPVGPRGGIWDTALFLEERGTATLFTPIASLSGYSSSGGRTSAELLPAVDLAVATHTGSDATIGEVYAGLGEYVARHELGAMGPIRERYLHESTGPGDDSITEIGWPILSLGHRTV